MKQKGKCSRQVQTSRWEKQVRRDVTGDTKRCEEGSLRNLTAKPAQNQNA
jgi:hypothetical protein